MTDVEGKFYKLIGGPRDGEVGVCELGGTFLDENNHYLPEVSLSTEAGEVVYQLIYQHKSGGSADPGTYKWQQNKGCPYCTQQPAKILDENGTLSSISGLPGRWGHGHEDGWAKCLNPPTPDPDPLPYLFSCEMIEQGLASVCDADECEGRVVIDGVCTWCGKEYPEDIPPNPNQKDLFE